MSTEKLPPSPEDIPPSGNLPPSPVNTLPNLPSGTLPPGSSFQAPPPKKNNMFVRLGLGCLGLLAVACVGIGGVVYYGTWQQQQAYNAGHAAYLKGDCTTAVGQLEKAIGDASSSSTDEVVLKARADLEECQALTDAQALTGGDAVLALSNFVTKYDQSPLRDIALGKAKEVATSSTPEELASIDFCNTIDDVSALGVFANPDESFPPLLYACGQTYENNSDYAAAVNTYTRFRDNYASHPLAADVEQAFARATIADAQASGSGALPPPQAIGDGNGVSGEVTVVIQNDAPDKLSMVFSGPETRVEELDACTDCEKFSGEAPEFCPELGPVGTYKLKPGTYTVVVKSGSGSDVTPFSGTWELTDGQEYSSCFYIVTGP